MDLVTEQKRSANSGKPFLTAREGECASLAARTSSPLAIYIHWPYCESKCPYCDFNSYARRTITEAQFLEGILAELRMHAARLGDRSISSVFFGGGTPSLMDPVTVGAILDAISGHWLVEANAEVTLEANPSSVEADRFAGYRTAGVNRVSLGVQSLQDDALKFLGRLHTAGEAKAALALASRIFDRWTFDLIYARPTQSPREWQAELNGALQLASGHISLYQLTIEPETAFFELERRGKLRTPPPDAAVALYEITQEICEAAGLPAYEISNHARPGQESLHNLTYWRYGEYAGVGPGAHGRLNRSGSRITTSTHRAPVTWYEQTLRDGHGWETSETLSNLEQAEEFIMMGLRLSEGISLQDLARRTGFTVPAADLNALVKHGCITVWDHDRLAATTAGRLVLNAVVVQLTGGLKPHQYCATDAPNDAGAGSTT